MVALAGSAPTVCGSYGVVGEVCSGCLQEALGWLDARFQVEIGFPGFCFPCFKEVVVLRFVFKVGCHLQQL